MVRAEGEVGRLQLLGDGSADVAHVCFSGHSVISLVECVVGRSAERLPPRPVHGEADAASPSIPGLNRASPFRRRLRSQLQTIALRRHTAAFGPNRTNRSVAARVGAAAQNTGRRASSRALSLACAPQSLNSGVTEPRLFPRGSKSRCTAAVSGNCRLFHLDSSG